MGDSTDEAAHIRVPSAEDLRGFRADLEKSNEQQAVYVPRNSNLEDPGTVAYAMRQIY